MGTERGTGASRYRHTDTRPWTDSTGQEWQVEVHWYEIAGRYEPARVTLDSNGAKGATSTVLRQFEQELGRRRDAEAASLAKIVVNARPEIRARAQRQLDLWRRERASAGTGRKRDDDHWLGRVLALYYARVDGRPMGEALAAWEKEQGTTTPTEATVRTLIKRAKAWDREVGTNLLSLPPDDLQAMKTATRLTKERKGR